jgi:Ca2+-binding RTX toxin-like protein
MTTTNGQVSLTNATLTFSPNALDSNAWNKEQTVNIHALNDSVVEGFHTDYIRYTVTSTDSEQLLPTGGGAPGTAPVFIAVDGDFDLIGPQASIPADKPTSYLLLPNRPDLTQPVAVRFGTGPDLAASRFEIRGNTLTFRAADGTPEFVTGEVQVKYSYKEPGYSGSSVKDSIVDIYDNDTPMVIVETVGDGSVDVIEGSGVSAETDQYSIRLSKAPDAANPVNVVVDSVDTRNTYGRTVHFVTQVNVAKSGVDVDGDDTKTTLTFTNLNWFIPQVITVSAIDDNFFDGNDTQVFAPDLQTVNKINGPLIIEGAAGAGSLSLPRPLMLPGELNILKRDGFVQGFIPGTGPGAIEKMTVKLSDLNLVIARLKLEDSNIDSLQDLIDRTLELSQGPGTGLVLDPLRPDDRYDRFWLITKVVDLLNGNVELTLQNPSQVDPGQANVTKPVAGNGDGATSYAITTLSANFFADEREQVDYLFVFDEDSVANDTGRLTSSDGAVQSFTAGISTDSMIVETSALQAVLKLTNLTDVNALLGLRLEITVGDGLGRAWTIGSIADGASGFKVLTLNRVSGAGTPTDRSEFRIAGGDTHGRITGFGMGPNVSFAGRPQPGGITYGDIEVVQMSLGSGNDNVVVDYATNSEDHTTKRGGDFYTLTMLDTGAGNDQVTVNLQDGDDGAFALNLNAGDDIANASASTLPVVIFGWDGNDSITGGSGNDILFGDIGRVDYVNTVAVDNDNNILTPPVLVDQIITRLGHSVAPNPVNPHVTGATANTVSDSHITFETTYGGLVGLSVQVISPQGHVQFRTIVANTAHTITVDRPWDQIPTLSYFYRVSAFPEDQTDGVFRGPRVVWSINNDIGGTDIINGGIGADILIGGAGQDTMHGDVGTDWLVGDNGRFDFVPVTGNDGPTMLSLVQTTGMTFGGGDTISGDAGADMIFGGAGGDAIFGDNSAASSGGSDLADIIIGDNGQIDFLNGAIASLTTTDIVVTTAGADTITGNVGADIILGGFGDDKISGLGGADILIGDQAKITYATGGVTLTKIDTIGLNPATGGIDTIYGGDNDDIIVGGANSDRLDGGNDRDLIFGDNVTLNRNAGSGDAIDPRFRALTGTIIYGPGGDIQVNMSADGVVPGGRPTWGADWTITLDPSPAAAAQFGNDYIAGGAQDDEIFGQLGDDTIQGDGSIGTVAGTTTGTFTMPSMTFSLAAGGSLTLASPTAFGASRNAAGVLSVAGSFEGLNDGDDYVEGNGGKDVIFGNLGQDDIIGGSSSLFSLSTPALRPDGADLIFGGAGTDIARNDAGDSAVTGHDRDSDVILGDNGNIFRLVGTGGVITANYLAFNYDNYSTLKIIPRAAQLLDYTPGGPDYTPSVESGPVDVAINPTTSLRDIGAADELHGESGDDFIYGQVGSDVLFGEGQNDSIIGGYGGDWISGGTGDDGILGDDGRIFISRNSSSFGESLYGIAAIPAAQINTVISENSLSVLAITNVNGALKYTVDMTPFSVDPTNAAPSTLMPRALYANDMIFGGLGDDSLHGGAGEDAISGGEAMALSYVNNYAQNGTISSAAPIESDYSHPVNPGNVLGYNPTTTKFALYDANDPLRKILLTATGGLSKTGSGLEWALNFTETEGPLDTASIVGTSYTAVNTDGADHVFGDLGHDWLVGGTGRDTLWGGWGDDLLNADDKLSTAGGLNNGPDTNPSWEDFAFGGAGRDVLIGNTGGDRLWDWTGEFNTFAVPYNPFGIPTVQRIFQPAMEAFMYALSRSQGADPTLAVQYGSSAARNGEPFGEIGAVLQQDAAWGDQTGVPRDPQSPLSNAKRDVNPSAGVQPLFETAAGLDNQGSGEGISDSMLEQVVSEAKLLWTGALGTDSRTALLDNMQIQVGNLPGDKLGVTIGGLILIDSNAAGQGWFVDSTPNDNSEFQYLSGTFVAGMNSDASDRMDLLTTVMHEIGHLLGYEHGADDVMDATLSPGQRKLEGPGTGEVTGSLGFESPGTTNSSVFRIDWFAALGKSGVAASQNGKRYLNGAGFPEFSLLSTDGSKDGHSVHGPKKKKSFHDEQEWEPQTEVDWYVEV